MRKLLTLSALLLFSVDVFAQDDLCVVEGDTAILMSGSIEMKCSEGDLLWAQINAREDSQSQAQMLSALHCDFEKEIVVFEDSQSLWLQCILYDDLRRQMLDTIVELVLGPLILGAIAFVVFSLIVEINKMMEKNYRDADTPTVEAIKKEKLKLKLKQMLLFWVIGFFLFYGVIL